MNRGFTLIELMIVLAVLGILLAIVSGANNSVESDSNLPQNMQQVQDNRVCEAGGMDAILIDGKISCKPKTKVVERRIYIRSEH